MTKKIIWKSDYPEMEIYEDGTVEYTNENGEYDHDDLRNLIEKLSQSVANYWQILNKPFSDSNEDDDL